MALFFSGGAQATPFYLNSTITIDHSQDVGIPSAFPFAQIEVTFTVKKPADFASELHNGVPVQHSYADTLLLNAFFNVSINGEPNSFAYSLGNSIGKLAADKTLSQIFTRDALEEVFLQKFPNFNAESDTATITGISNITGVNLYVPEPSTFALLFCGLIVLGLGKADWGAASSTLPQRPGLPPQGGRAAG